MSDNKRLDFFSLSWIFLRVLMGLSFSIPLLPTFTVFSKRQYSVHRLFRILDYVHSFCFFHKQKQVKSTVGTKLRTPSSAENCSVLSKKNG